MRIYAQYNLPYLARPGDDLFAAARLDQIQKMQDEHFRRLARGQDEAEILSKMNAQLSESKVTQTKAYLNVGIFR